MSKALFSNNKLSQRVLVYILLCSSVLSLCTTSVQLYADYNDDLSALKQRFVNIEISYIPSIATSLWDFNEPLVQQQIQGIVQLPDIRYAKIVTGLGNIYEFGDPDVVAEDDMEYPVFYGDNDIGTLKVFADYQDIYQRLWQRAGFIITSEFIKIFIVALCIVFIVHLLITRHLYRITHYSQELASDNLNTELSLSNRPGKKDELDLLVDAINDMRLTLKSDIQKREVAENALIQLNGELEVKVYDRTAKLEHSNQQLQQSLDDLTLAKDQLVQSEKMASLGQLVAGVAHEVNTPLGICVTSITALKEKVDALKRAVDSQELTKSHLSSTLSVLTEYQLIIERSLNKSVELIRGFKSVAVEQHTDPELKINLSRQVHDIVNTVKTMFKHKKYQIHLDIDPELSLVTYPSAWNQILTNFLMNSHVHGFEGRDTGNISISFTEEDGYLTLLYKDDGVGINKGIKKRVFDPFVTTKRGQGGSGLGLNIVFNLVDAKLGGVIKCLDVDKGCCFQVRVPIVHADSKKLADA
ncbi:ATP-binding protein [Thalassomonas actiniarum]|uniref:histidine kinase n=1 Tax=Thalassomonas actiniarum TaxID=485447 RepID=A0AAE9YRI8_9GAMM|nr:ATP-binding protein [Thalassomonas actiniarum]WDD99919.1 HAMP domain-containing protein [Thalassomonas actiniarum]